MKVLSFNSIGVGGAPKIQPLKRLVLVSNLDIIMVQNKMCSVVKAKEVFSSFLWEWSFCAIDSMGFSRGLIYAWSPKIKYVQVETIPSIIVVDL